MLEDTMDFTEDFKFPGSNKVITFTAESFNKWVRNTMPIVKDMPKLTLANRTKGIPVGKFFFSYCSMEKESMQYPYRFADKMVLMPNKLSIHIALKTAWVKFDDTIYVPILCTQYQTWMSLTPNEILTQRGKIKRTHGNVCIAGLGLGWAARKILQRTKVKSLTIVEKDKDILDFFGTEIKQEYQGVKNVTLINDDAYNFDYSSFDVSYWDIWAGYNEASEDSEFQKIKQDCKNNGKVCLGWGDIRNHSLA